MIALTLHSSFSFLLESSVKAGAALLLAVRPGSPDGSTHSPVDTLRAGWCCQQGAPGSESGVL